MKDKLTFLSRSTFTLLALAVQPIEHLLYSRLAVIIVNLHFSGR